MGLLRLSAGGHGLDTVEVFERNWLRKSSVQRSPAIGEPGFERNRLQKKTSTQRSRRLPRAAEERKRPQRFREKAGKTSCFRCH